MARISSFVLVVAVAIGAAMIPAAATAATTNTTATNTTATGTTTAPATPASTPTATEISTATATVTETSGEPDTNTVRYQLGSNVQITGYSYSDGVFRVKVKTDTPTRIVVSDALGPLSDSGVSEVPQRSIFVDGTQTIKMDVEEYRGGAAVSVATSGGTVYISTGITTSGNPFEGGSPTVGWIGGASLAVLMFVLAGVWKLRRESTTPRIAKQGPKRGENK